MKRREPLSNTQLLMFIAIGIFAVMYAAAIVGLGDAFTKFQQFFNLLNDNAYLIIIGCALTVVMIGGGINISVGGVISLTVMACALFLNGTGLQNGLGVIVSLLLALGIGLAFGIGQGFLVSYLEIQPFIVTLAGMFLARGLTTILSVNPVKVTEKTHAVFYAFRGNKIEIPFLGYPERQSDSGQVGDRSDCGHRRRHPVFCPAAVCETRTEYLRTRRKPTERPDAWH